MKKNNNVSSYLNDVREGNVAMVAKCLKNRSLQVDVLDNKGCTPLFVACGARQNRVQMVRLLLQHGSDVNIVSSAAGNSVLHYALVKKPVDYEKEGGNAVKIISLLLNESKSLAVLKNINNDSPLAFACVNADFEAISYLLNFDEAVQNSLHEPNLSGVSPLTVICNSQAPRESKYKCLLQFVKFLEKDDINFQTPANGNTALHVLVETSFSRGILLLLSTDADITIKNIHGLNAIDLAKYMVNLVEKNADKPDTNPRRSFTAIEKQEARECFRILESAWASKNNVIDKIMNDLILEEDLNEQNMDKKSNNGNGKKRKKKKKKKKKSNALGTTQEKKNNKVTTLLMEEKQSIPDELVAEKSNLTPMKKNISNTNVKSQNGSSGNKWMNPNNKIINIINSNNSASNMNNSEGVNGNSEKSFLTTPNQIKKTKIFTAQDYENQFEKICPLSSTLDIKFTSIFGIGLTELSMAQIEALEMYHDHQLRKLSEIKMEQRNHLARLDKLNKTYVA